MAHALLDSTLDLLDALIAFDTRSSESNLALIDFIPPPGAVGLFEATLELFDSNNNEFDIRLSGGATIPEPPTLVLFGFALGGLAFARRLRP